VRRLLASLMAAGAMALLLCGCDFKLFKSAEDLYMQPQLPVEYQELDSTIKAEMNALNAESTTPLSGSNTSAVQLLDLDGDGVEEAAAAFFRVTDAEDAQPLKIYLFRLGDDGEYEVAYRLQGEGNSIESIAYEDMDGDGAVEVVVSWQLTSRAYVLSVYDLGRDEASELIHTTYNENYVLVDLNEDGYKELVVIQRDDTGEDVSRASYYEYEGGVLVMTSAAPLSEGITDVLSARTGILVGRRTAIYVTSTCADGQVTDIFIWKNGEITNITRSVDSGVSNDTLRDYTSVSAMDINKDGVLEIPVAVALPSMSEDSTTQWLIYWRQFNGDGESTVACETYHSITDGWYLMLPNDWDGQISVERDDRENYRGERSVVFYHWNKNGEAKRFMTIYRLSGSNAAARAALGGRTMLLSQDSNTAYAVELSKDGWNCGLTAEQIQERFSLITTEWSTIS
jgi:hypothetical protein